MKNQAMNVEAVEVRESSGNVFADMGLPNPEKMMMKADLAIQIIGAMKDQKLSQQQAAERMGITQPKVSALVKGDFSILSERKLLDCLQKMGFDVEIKIKPAKTIQASGKLELVFG